MLFPLAAWVAGAAVCISIAGGPAIGVVALCALPVLLVGVFAIGEKAAWWQWGAAGGALALAWGGSQLAAFWRTSPIIAVASTLSHVAFVAAVFGLGASVARATRTPLYKSLAVAWFLGATLLEESGWYAMHLSTGMFSASSYTALVARLVGPAGVDAIILLTCGAIASRNWLGTVASVLGTVSLAVLGTSLGRSGAEPVHVHVVQPNISSSEYRAAGWSVPAGLGIAARFSELTRLAATGQDGLIVWPEGGTGVPDLQVPSRRAEIARAMQGSGSDLIVATTLVGELARHNGVGLLRAGSVRGLAFKQHTVPIAESDLAAGHSEVLDTRAGLVGVLVCFDGMFAGDVRKLVARGAELLVLTTDDASLGRTAAVSAHLAESRYAAASSGVPLVIASNAGPSLLQDAQGRIVSTSETDQMAVLSGTLSPQSVPRFVAWGPRVTVVVLALAGLLGFGWRTLIVSPLKRFRDVAPI